jgi:hypothetical protein
MHALKYLNAIYWFIFVEPNLPFSKHHPVNPVFLIPLMIVAASSLLAGIFILIKRLRALVLLALSLILLYDIRSLYFVLLKMYKMSASGSQIGYVGYAQLLNIVSLVICGYAIYFFSRPEIKKQFK